jgi:hypothetical protein
VNEPSDLVGFHARNHVVRFHAILVRDKRGNGGHAMHCRDRWMRHGVNRQELNVGVATSEIVVEGRDAFTRLTPFRVELNDGRFVATIVHTPIELFFRVDFNCHI